MSKRQPQLLKLDNKIVSQFCFCAQNCYTYNNAVIRITKNLPLTFKFSKTMFLDSSISKIVSLVPSMYWEKYQKYVFVRNYLKIAFGF